MHARETPRPEVGAWWHQAECAKPEHATVDWFPSRGQSVEPLRDICAACPVRDECLDDQLPEKFGFRGGMSEQQRRTERKRRGVPGRMTSVEAFLDLSPHGTEAAYRRHFRHGEQPCEACRGAIAEAQRERRRLAESL